MAVSDYSTTAGDNTSISGITVSDATVADQLDNIVRQMMADTKAFYDVTGVMTLTRLTSGTAATYTTPTNCQALFVRVQGAGGGSGDATANGSGSAGMSMGAGAGGYTQKYIASPAATYTYTIGAAGAGGSGAGTAGSTGGTTTFTDGVSLTLTANGGVGTAAAVGQSGSVAISSAAGGTASGGDVNFQGGYSHRAVIDGGAISSYPIGGASMMGPGGVNVGSDGQTPRGYGGGASGASVWGVAATNQGADGAPAVIEVWEIYR